MADDIPIVVRKKGPKLGRFGKVAVVSGAFAFICILGAGAAMGCVYFKYKADLPAFDDLDQYRPPVSTKVYAIDGRLIGEFATERRDVVPYDQVPTKLVQAFIAAEDQEFFLHQGMDPRGIVRAFIKNLRTGRKVAGGSTITQQVAKTYVGREKTYTRKIRELLLALRLEKKFSKRDILFLYLNQIYLGHGLYGVQAASRGYFRKNVWELNLAEMAILAGLPQAPARYSPYLNPKKADERRRYVLDRMFEDGYVTQDERTGALDAKVPINDIEDYFKEKAPYFTEHVRRYLYDKYGEDALYRGGMQVYTTVDLDKQYIAEEALIRGVKEIDKRQGYRGPLHHADRAEWDAWLARLDRQTAKDGGALRPEQTYVALVLAIAADGKSAAVAVGKRTGTLPVAAMRWAHKAEMGREWEKVESVGRVLGPGDLIQVRLATKKDLTHVYEPGSLMPPPGDPIDQKTFALDQDPSVQGALVSEDPQSGYVLAMIGGYSFEVSEFNRAFQACRQPGSAFKPIVYAAAIDKLNYTPSTIIVDSPLVFDDAENQLRWKPQNFEQDFRGDVTLRNAVIHSLNVPAVKVLNAVGVGAAIDYAKKFGIRTGLAPNLSLALGGSCVTLWDLTNVFAGFARLGVKKKPVFIRKIVDRDGEVVENHSHFGDPFLSPHERAERAAHYAGQTDTRVLDARSAFILLRLMREVCTNGTGAAAARLGQPLAGKTGTTNDAFDAWFMGFSKNLVTGVWVGFDTYERPLGRWETGGKAALPIWMAYMGEALKGRKEPEWEAPPGITFARVHYETGLLMPPGSPGGISQPFKVGTTPDETAGSSSGAASGTTDFMKIDSD
ncbi:MAG: PBP1A family penicillin-binding protein [Deltaproteobacteria bacterium]|nr:PBP1A family penicillin-binding protein [Deltaproteobacteria bacterium]